MLLLQHSRVRDPLHLRLQFTISTSNSNVHFQRLSNDIPVPRFVGGYLLPRTNVPMTTKIQSKLRSDEARKRLENSKYALPCREKKSNKKYLVTYKWHIVLVAFVTYLYLST